MKADSTKNPRDETELTDFSKIQFEALFNFATYGIWVMDGQGNVLKVNPAAEELIGIKAGDVVGRNIVKLAEEGIINEALTPYVLTAKEPVKKVLHVLKTDKYIMATGTPVFDASGNIILVVVHEYDMTMLNTLKTQLEQMRNVAEKYKNELSDLSLRELKKYGIIAKSQEMRQVLRVALKLARLDMSNILILGESGTGKGLVAKFIHENSTRRKKAFIQLNCAALPESLLEAELFGFEKGAFTGAKTEGKIGLFELAQGGTLFLDEIGDIPLAVQAKLLKCLEDHEILRLGGLKPIQIDCTIIAATNRKLERRVQEKQFREDLYHRLNTFNLYIPPLRKRPEDIPELAHHYLDEFNQAFGLQRRLSPGALSQLQSHPFTGNVRELKNMLKHAVVMNETDILNGFSTHSNGRTEEAGQTAPHAASEIRGSLAEQLNAHEKRILEQALRHCHSTRQLADYLGTNQSKIARSLKKHDLSKYLHRKRSPR
jgi:PAS domain S-box-containing protein